MDQGSAGGTAGEAEKVSEENKPEPRAPFCGVLGSDAMKGGLSESLAQHSACVGVPFRARYARRCRARARLADTRLPESPHRAAARGGKPFRPYVSSRLYKSHYVHVLGRSLPPPPPI